MSEKILFGTGGGLKKRDGKAGEKEQEKQDKLEMESQRSGDSRASRSTNGRFEGSTKFCENTFIMKGFTKGKQQWKCLSC